MMIFYVMILLFICGVVMIALEDVLKINKAAVSIGMSILLWILTIVSATGVFHQQLPEFFSNFVAGFPHFAELSFVEQVYRFIEITITESLGDVSTTLFFVLASMAIIEILDAHGSFSVITHLITATDKRKLLWIFSLTTFFLSALLGNIAAVIVMIAVRHKLVGEKKDTLIYASMMIIAANAGGSWSPIGDVTTLLLWTNKNITAVHQISSLILPSAIMMAVPTLFCTFAFGKGEKAVLPEPAAAAALPAYITKRFQMQLLVIGLLSLALVPVFQSIFDLPPFMGVLLGLVVLWIFTDLKAAKAKDDSADALKVSHLFSKLDLSTILFFLGILMSVKALDTIGVLTILSNGLSQLFENEEYIAMLLGVCSSFLDNVALVAATMGMYPLEAAGVFATDSSFWTFLAYSCVTGGSLLIIGSAAGVTAMGLEKISFGYYLKKFTPLAIAGYVAGAAVYLLLF